MGVGVLFESVRTLMWPQNCHMSIFRSIHLQHWYPNVNIQIDPFATLVPKLPNVNTQIDPFATLVPKLPNVNIQIDPFATLVPKCQYSDRSIRNPFGWGRNPNVIIWLEPQSVRATIIMKIAIMT